MQAHDVKKADKTVDCTFTADEVQTIQQALEYELDAHVNHDPSRTERMRHLIAVLDEVQAEFVRPNHL